MVRGWSPNAINNRENAMDAIGGTIYTAKETWE